jgi:hypothetical protein
VVGPSNAAVDRVRAHRLCHTKFACALRSNRLLGALFMPLKGRNIIASCFLGVVSNVSIAHRVA